MGNRLSKIATRTGDAGTTGLGDGSRVGKDSPRIDALGEVDELNSMLGVLLADPFHMEMVAFTPATRAADDATHEARLIGDAAIEKCGPRIKLTPPAIANVDSPARKLCTAR